MIIVVIAFFRLGIKSLLLVVKIKRSNDKNLVTFGAKNYIRKEVAGMKQARHTADCAVYDGKIETSGDRDDIFKHC